MSQSIDEAFREWQASVGLDGDWLVGRIQAFRAGAEWQAKRFERLVKAAEAASRAYRRVNNPDWHTAFDSAMAELGAELDEVKG